MTAQQPGLTALAKQGDVNAIAALINRTLQPKGIVAKVTHQSGHLRVLLEGQTVPDQKTLAPYIRNGIMALQISGLHTLSVWGRSQGTSNPAWNETFALAPADTGLGHKSQRQMEPVHSERQQPINASDAKADKPLIGSKDSSNEQQDAAPTGALVTNPEAIASHINQAMGTETLVFETTLSERVLKLTAKTNQILEGGTFAKTVQNLLLPLNLTDIDLVHLYKQKANGNAPYKIKEFTLHPEPAPTEATVNGSADVHPTGAAEYQSPRSQPTASQPIEPKPQASPKSKFVVVALVALVVVLFIGAIKFLAKPPAATEICQEAVGAPGYCQLAVQIVGEQTLHDLKDSATPFTPEMEEKGVGLCARATELQMQRKFVRQQTRYGASSRKELVFPGLMLVEMQLKNAPKTLGKPTLGKPTLGKPPPVSTEAEATVFRSACLFGGNENRVELIKNVVLPNNWPQEPYQGKQEWEPMQRSLKVYQILLMLGGGTLFTAIGLFAASALNLGVQIYSIRGLCQTASILGTMDTLLLVMSGAKFNLFGGIPLTCLALGLTQVWVKDLRVDWAAGYRTVALGVFLMMVIRFVLNWLMLGFIFSVL